MTKREREQVREAIRLLRTDEGYEDAMRILLKMADWRWPAAEAARSAEQAGRFVGIDKRPALPARPTEEPGTP